MPDLWDTNPHNAFSTPDEQPEPASSGHDDDHTKEVTFRDHRGHPPATRLRPDRTGDRVSGHPALARRGAGRAQLAPGLVGSHVGWTAKMCHSSGTPLRAWIPHPRNRYPATRSFTVEETTTSSEPASEVKGRRSANVVAEARSRRCAGRPGRAGSASATSCWIAPTQRIPAGATSRRILIRYRGLALCAPAFPRSSASVVGEGMRSYSPTPDRRTGALARPRASYGPSGRLQGAHDREIAGSLVGADHDELVHAGLGPPHLAGPAEQLAHIGR